MSTAYFLMASGGAFIKKPDIEGLEEISPFLGKHTGMYGTVTP